MFKNVASQKLVVFAFDSTTNLPKTGDASNITAYVSKDFGTVTVLGDTTATEMDSTNAKGYYLFDLTQSETNSDVLTFSAKSSTSNIVVVAVPAVVATIPPNFSSQAIDSSGQVSVGTMATTALNANADALLDRTSGVESSYTLRQAMRLMLSALAGKLSGAATTTVSIRDVNDSKTRITATVDTNGNRTAVTTDVT